MGVTVCYFALLWELVTKGTLGDAGFQGALCRISSKIVGTLPTTGEEQDLRLLQAKLREDLKILAGHVRSVYQTYLIVSTNKKQEILLIQPCRIETISPIENVAPPTSSATPIQRSL